MKAIQLLKMHFRIKSIIEYIFTQHALDVSENFRAVEFIQGMIFVSELSNEEIATELMEIIAGDQTELGSGN